MEKKEIERRERFAVMAMQGILANPSYSEELKVNDWGIDGNRVALNALDCADALIKLLATPKQ